MLFIMFTDVINIGYSSFPELLIPRNNVINLHAGTRRSHGLKSALSCFTTRGYENPVWILSNNEFSTEQLVDGMTTLANGNVMITVERISVYWSQIYINITDITFTGNLTCQSQNNQAVQHTVIVTTSKNLVIYIV